MSIREVILVFLFLVVVSTANTADTSTTAEESSSSVVDDVIRFLRGGGNRQLGKTPAAPKWVPTKQPSKQPTKQPSKQPSKLPTRSPTISPTPLPTSNSNASNDANSREQEWAINKAKWDTFISAGSNPPPHDGYEMIYQQTSSYYDYSLPFRVTVSKEGTVVGVKNMDGTTVTDPVIIGRIKTVDQAFDIIKDAWLYAAIVTVTYDTEKGYPMNAYIDESLDRVDEEIIFTIKDVSLRSLFA